MFRFHVVQAEFGDCLLLEFGSKGNPRFVLIDGGPPSTFDDHLSGVLTQIAKTKAPLDLTVLSHVDDDHIVGLVDYFSAMQAGAADLPKPKELWHNSWGKALDPGGQLAPRIASLMTLTRTAAMPYATHALLGIEGGNALRTKATLLGVPINQSIGNGALITVDDVHAPFTFDNLTLQVVAPTKANLESLHKEWEAWLDKHEADLATDDPKVMANSDRSVPNLSSIALLAKADGKSILLTGDGRSDHLLQGMKQAGVLDADGSGHVDVLKLAHHGSDRDVTQSFFKTVTADTYVASANGRYGNPDIATLVWIVDQAKQDGRKITLVVTNDTPSLAELKAKCPPDKYSYTVELMPKGDHSLVLTLAE
ncbi:MAG TPA: MBL fold metallo-hydrolase [Gemmatimonadales bacterium]|nr:MBL fold metallo-hydrolase [Gemmatimonadales bacterium]